MPLRSDVADANAARMAMLRRLLAIVLVIVAVWGSLVYLPGLIWRDVQAPTWVTPQIDKARSDLFRHANDFGVPFLHLTLIDARCTDDGKVALIFEGHRPPYLASEFGYIIGRRVSTEELTLGNGGYVPAPPYDDEEFVFLMGSDPPRCTE